MYAYPPDLNDEIPLVIGLLRGVVPDKVTACQAGWAAVGYGFKVTVGEIGGEKFSAEQAAEVLERHHQTVANMIHKPSIQMMTTTLPWAQIVKAILAALLALEQ